MSPSIRASSPTPAATDTQPAPSVAHGLKPARKFRHRSQMADSSSSARPHSLLGYLPSFPQRSSMRPPAQLAPTPEAPAPKLTRRVSNDGASTATARRGSSIDGIAPSIHLDPFATGEFQDTNPRRFLGVGPKMYSRAERELKDKLRSQARFTFDELAVLRESNTDLRQQLDSVRADCESSRGAYAELEQTLRGHKDTIRSFQSVFQSSIAEVSDLKEQLRDKEAQLEQIKQILLPKMTLTPTPATLARPIVTAHRSFGRQTFGLNADAAADDVQEQFGGPSGSAN